MAEILTWAELRDRFREDQIRDDVSHDALKYWLKCDPPIPVHQLGRRGQPHLFDYDAVLVWYADRVENEKKGWTPPTAENPRDELIRFKAARERLRFEKESGKLLDADDVRRATEKIFANVRARLLAIPSSLAAPLGTCKTAGARQQLIENALVAALEELSSAEPAPTPASGTRRHRGNAGRPATAAPSNGDGVGRSKSKTQPRGKRRAGTVPG
jgi:hypothetical protein